MSSEQNETGESCILDLRIRLYHDALTNDVRIEMVDRDMISADHMQMLASLFVANVCRHSREGWEHAMEVIMVEAMRAKPNGQ